MPIKFNPIGKAEVLKQTGDATTLRVLVTSNGSPERKDLHGEFFHPDTNFGDVGIDGVVVKMGCYEHLMNNINNPYMPKEKQFLGGATLAKTDDWGRWYDFEIKRSLEYHDFLVALVEKGIMGASTQCLPNGKSMNPLVEGQIDMWLESEVSLTPTPADPKTLGQIIQVAKSFGYMLPLVKDGQLATLSEEELDTYIQTLDSLEPAAVSEPAVTQVSDDFDADEYVAGIEATLNGEPEEAAPVAAVEPVVAVPTETDEDLKQMVKALTAEMAAMKASMYAFFEIWGADMDDAKEAIMSLFGSAKAVQEEVVPTLNRINKKADASLKSNETFASYMRSFKEGEAGRRFAQMSSKERQLLDNIENEEELESPKGFTERLFNNRIPVGAPGSN